MRRPSLQSPRLRESPELPGPLQRCLFAHTGILRRGAAV